MVSHYEVRAVNVSYKPKYIQIRDELTDRIMRGVLKPSGLFPSEREIVEEFSVSRYTAIKAVQELEREGVVIREKGKGTFVAPSVPTQGIEMNQNHKIGIVISDLGFVGLPYTSRFLKGVNEKLNIFGYNLVLFGLTGTTDSKTFSVEDIVEKNQVDGLLIDDNIPPDVIKFLCERQFPFVQFGSDVGRIKGYNYSRVVNNSNQLIEQGIEYFLKKGRQRIAFIQGYVSEQTKSHTVKSLIDIMKTHGLEENPEYLCMGFYGEESGRELARKLLNVSPLPDAIITNEDMLALGAAREIQSQGILIPEDISIVGVGDYLLEPWLTTFRLPNYEMGRSAADILIRKLNPTNKEKEEFTEVLKLELIIRQT